MYDEYVANYKEETKALNEVNVGNNSSANAPCSSKVSRFNHYMSIVREKQSLPLVKSELEVYLEEATYIPDGSSNSFSALK